MRVGMRRLAGSPIKDLMRTLALSVPLLFSAIACEPDSTRLMSVALESDQEVGILVLAANSGDDDDALYRVQGSVELRGPLVQEIDVLAGDARSGWVQTESLPVGSYTAELRDGYQLQVEVDGKYVDVDSELTSPNPMPFVIAASSVTPVTFVFSVGEFDVGLSQGEVAFGVGVVDASDGPVSLSAGGRHTCALMGLGAVRCWGDNEFGQLGQGDLEDVGDDEAPATVGSVDIGGPAVSVVSGGTHSCALLDSGAVRCWGNGAFGQLGYGNTDIVGDDEVPASAGDVDVGGNVIQLSAGDRHTCALLDTGGVRCWGSGASGRLGYFGTENLGDDETPASRGDVDLGGPAVQIAAGATHTCALLLGGAVRCWGNGALGALGYADTNSIGDDEFPAEAGDISVEGHVVHVAAGGERTCALLSTGSVRCWGLGTDGRLGYGNTSTVGDDETPASAGDVDLGGPVVQLALGAAHSCALLATGAVRCWGSASGSETGANGVLGYGNTLDIGDNEPPAAAGDVDVGDAVVRLAAGDNHTCALLKSGGVRCWGDGASGALGYGNTSDVGDNETPSAVGLVDVGSGAAP